MILQPGISLLLEKGIILTRTKAEQPGMLKRIYTIHLSGGKYQCYVFYPTLPKGSNQLQCIAESKDIHQFLQDIPFFLKDAEFAIKEGEEINA